MRVAACAWTFDRHDDWSGYATKLNGIADGARGADLLVFPEYAGLEAAMVGNLPGPATADWTARSVEVAARAVEAHIAVSRRLGSHVLMGSLAVEGAEGPVNRAHFIAPDGTVRWQDKQMPTPWERAETPITPGDAPCVFDSALGRIGVLICYDGEFPVLTRALACEVLLMPSCTDTPAGAARVRLAARARALEGGCWSVLAQTVREMPACPFVDTNRGRAGIYAPPDRGCPPDGIVTETAPEVPGWAVAEIDPHRVPMAGEVDVAGDWPAMEARASLVGGRDA